MTTARGSSDQAAPEPETSEPETSERDAAAPTQTDVRELLRARQEEAARAAGARAKWTVLEHFVHDGFAYQLRRRPSDKAPATVHLTKREEEVLARLFGGESNKIIAYELGLAPSTVGVLLFRAAAKLGAKSREELLSAYARTKKSPDQT